jgi:DNA mismatch repair protein MSH6
MAPPTKSTPGSQIKNQTSLFSFFRKNPATESPSTDTHNNVEVTPKPSAMPTMSTPAKSPAVATSLPSATAVVNTPVVANNNSMIGIKKKIDDEDEAFMDSDDDPVAKKPKRIRTSSANKSRSKSTKRPLDSDEDDDNDEDEDDDDEGSAYEEEEDADENDDDEDDFVVSDDEDDHAILTTKKRKTPTAKLHSKPTRKSSSLPPKPPLSSSTTKSKYVLTDARSPSPNKAARDTATPFLSTPQSRTTANRSETGSVNASPLSTVTAATPQSIMPEGVEGPGSHEHDQTMEFLLPKHRRDANNHQPTHPDYNPRTLRVPASFLKEQTPAMAQWWHFKCQNMDTVLFFKVGKFYELFHMDADIGFTELDLIYMKGKKAHSGFPEVSYGKYASMLVAKG